jgi:hypothetical protein
VKRDDDYSDLAQSAELRARRGADNFLRLARPFCAKASKGKACTTYLQITKLIFYETY